MSTNKYLNPDVIYIGWAMIYFVFWFFEIYKLFDDWKRVAKKYNF